VKKLLWPAIGAMSTFYLAAHNAKRALHCNTPAMVLDATLEAQAQAYADTCPTDHAAQRFGAGENLYWMGASSAASLGTVQSQHEGAAQSWYDEIANCALTSEPVRSVA
jgi:hypothetical protein